MGVNGDGNGARENNSQKTDKTNRERNPMAQLSTLTVVAATPASRIRAAHMITLVAHGEMAAGLAKVIREAARTSGVSGSDRILSKAGQCEHFPHGQAVFIGHALSDICGDHYVERFEAALQIDFAARDGAEIWARLD